MQPIDPHDDRLSRTLWHRRLACELTGETPAPQSCGPTGNTQILPDSLTGGAHGRHWRRRGSIMIFVLGILTMLALIGLVLIARTHGESKRVANELSASSGQATMTGTIRAVRETLRRDIWGEPPSPLTMEPDAPLANDNPPGFLENNEPYDAPGKSDLWLTSTLPYYFGDILVNAIDPDDETDVLAWHRVSYLGTDIIRNDTARPFQWSATLLAPPPSLVDAPEIYTDDDLTNVWVLQTPPTALAGINLIPGSTTNLTIAEARQRWRSDPPLAPLGVTPRFPYFDTNANGIIDLYDADGDGVPDSPISFSVPFDNADPHGPQELYAVIRIVDHASMLNVNVASGLALEDNSLTFNETSSDLQRRGRRMTELLFDDVVHADDTALGQVAGLVAHRSVGDDPATYDSAVVRTKLAGSPVDVSAYSLYGKNDEASLRHRGLLVPRDRLNDRTPPAGFEFATIDRALPGSLLWSRDLIGNSYNPLIEPRWNRFNANFLSTAYEGYNDAGGVGWRTLLRDDEPYTIRRSLLTTVSHEVVPPPSSLTFTDNGTPDFGADDTILGLADTHPINILTATGLRMAWPVLDREFFPEIPDWQRVLPIDVNMSNPDPAAETQTKVEYIQYMAAAMYMALKDVRSYQGTPLFNAIPTLEDDSLNREYLAWQFAVNIADYRDSDGIPTVVEWVYQDPGGPDERSRLIFGVEKQPFFTEAFAHLTNNGGSGPSGTHDPNPSGYNSFFAFELFVPPGWIAHTENLYIRVPGADISRLIGLNEFTRVSDGEAPVLDGGTTTGNYFVFCGPTTHSYNAGVADTVSFYRFAGFDIATDGHGSIQLVYSPDGDWNNPESHVIDIIGADYTGGPLAGNQMPGVGAWADENEVGPGAAIGFSLHRSTKGWRFTTARQVYSNPGPSGTHQPTLPPSMSLGRKNAAYTPLDSNIPESIWPTLCTLASPDHEPLFPKPTGGGGITLARGFTTGKGFEAFDSVAELSRIFMIGPVRLYDGYRTPTLPWIGPGELDMPVTLLLARIAETWDNQGELAGNPNYETELRIMAGRPCFVHAYHETGQPPWTSRLFNLLTTQSPLYDGIDNDGDDPGDGSLTDLNDRTEGITTINRLAGRININTAPAVVLRSLPFMSMLPTSAEYVRHALGGTPPVDPAMIFNNDMASGSPIFWDFASAIVSHRENRPVPLRLWDNGAGAMVAVATAERTSTQSGPGGTSGGSDANDKSPKPFVSISELADLRKITDLQSGGTNSHLFSFDRFWKFSGSIPLMNHSLAAGPRNDALSPDFRFRDDGTGAGTGLYDHVALADPAYPYDNGGMRSRDIFLTRLSNMLTTRSDVFTAYIALIDENGNYVHRSQVTLDRSECFRENPADPQRRPILPRILHREDSSYQDDTR